MKKQLPKIEDIFKRIAIPQEKASALLKTIKKAMQPYVKSVSVIEEMKRRRYKVQRNGIGFLQTKYGEFWLYHFFINDQWGKYSVLVRASLDKNSLFPVFKNKNQLILRIDSGCESGQIFGDLTCECRDQLFSALKIIKEFGEGMIIHIPGQDGRGMSSTFKLATLWVQKELSVNNIEASVLLEPTNIIDARTYSGVIAILKFFGIPKNTKIRLITNNPEKTYIFTKNNYQIGKSISCVIEPNEFTQEHLKAKQIYFGHKGLIAQQ